MTPEALTACANSVRSPSVVAETEGSLRLSFVSVTDQVPFTAGIGARHGRRAQVCRRPLAVAVGVT